MSVKGPLALVKDTFGDKQKLVASLEALTKDDLWVSRTNKEKGLAHVSNAKLLRLHATFSAVKAKFGTRDKLITELMKLESREKETGYAAKLGAYPVPRLWDMYNSTEKRVRTAAKKADAAKAPKAAKVAKAPVKAEKKAVAKPAAKKAAKKR